jgi:hypothetical protein
VKVRRRSLGGREGGKVTQRDWGCVTSWSSAAGVTWVRRATVVSWGRRETVDASDILPSDPESLLVFTLSCVC